MLPTDLAEEFREKARLFREHEDWPVARAYEICANRVEEVIADSQDAVLTLSQAAKESGYSSDHLGRLIRDGAIPNAGRPGAPRIRRGDLPLKPGGSRPPQPVASSARQIVRSVLHDEEGS